MAFHVVALSALLLVGASAIEYHVAVTGNDANDGSAQRPFRTVQFASTVAQDGDAVTVHAGIYRERVHPATGGVLFQAASGDAVTISGAEPVSGWSPVVNNTWRVVLSSYSYFGNFNP
jgi:alpha-L-arabinofuranosidase